MIAQPKAEKNIQAANALRHITPIDGSKAAHEVPAIWCQERFCSDGKTIEGCEYHVYAQHDNVQIVQYWLGQDNEGAAISDLGEGFDFCVKSARDFWKIKAEHGMLKVRWPGELAAIAADAKRHAK